VLRVGLTGGIGSGKSEVARRLVAHGAVLIDADLVAREVVEPGTPGLAAVVAEFGAAVLRPDGSLDRERLGSIVFADPGRRAALNAIVHPLVGRRMAELDDAAPAGAVVVYDVPLLTENDLAGTYDTVVVVDAPVETQLTRLVGDRGMTEEAARARIAAQATRERRRAIADHVIDNSGTLGELSAQVDALWTELSAKAARGAPRRLRRRWTPARRGRGAARPGGC
jgi:dephospho-CoA kinase